MSVWEPCHGPELRLVITARRKENDRLGSSQTMMTMSDIVLPVLDPDKAYRGSWLWVPKRRIAVESQKASLELVLGRNKTIRMWREAPNHLGVPRALIPVTSLRCETVDITPKFRDVYIKSNVELDRIDPSKTTQRDAFADLRKAEGGILNLACGAGKTVVMLHAIAARSKPTLIISHQEEILEQWRGEISDHLVVKDKIGWIQGKPAQWDWKRSITLGMIRTLAKYREEVPLGMPRHYGTVTWDEIHHLAAPDYCKTADLFPGYRFGATATVERGDGSEIAYLWHIGGVIHKNLDQDLVPKVYFLRSPTRVNMDSPRARRAVTDSNRNIHIKRLLIYVGTQDEEIRFIMEHLQDAMASGRKILALSSSVEQLEILHLMFPGSGLITGDIKEAAARRRALHDTKLCFGTVDLAKEALNDRALDTLFLLTEFVKDAMLQQAVGRIQRIMDGKRDPYVVVVRHHKIKPLERMAKKMEKYFHAQNFRVRTT
jgi:superfamily II DNA or RNA helicase